MYNILFLFFLGIETPLFANIELNDDCVYADLFKIPTAEITTTTTENINLTYNSTRSGKLVWTPVHTFQRSKDLNK